jgi:hypothetical protein
VQIKTGKCEQEIQTRELKRQEGCHEIHYIATALQNCYISRINGKEKQERRCFNDNLVANTPFIK